MIIHLKDKKKENKTDIKALLKVHFIKHAIINNAKDKLTFFKRIIRNYSSKHVN